MTAIDITIGSELPDKTFAWRDSAGALIQFGSVPHTFSFRIATTPTFTKSTGITGADTDPNVTVAFTVGELDSLTPGVFAGELHAKRTSDSKDRNPLRFTATITAPIT